MLWEMQHKTRGLMQADADLVPEPKVSQENALLSESL